MVKARKQRRDRRIVDVAQRQMTARGEVIEFIAMPAVPIVRSGLASAYGLRGENERAAAELAEARRLNGGDLFSSIAYLKADWGWGVPKTHALFEATYFAGLRKAGMPEQ